MTLALSGVWASAAHADMIITPPILHYGSHLIGTTSPPQTLTLTETCNQEMMCAPDPFEPDPEMMGDYTIVSDTCPPVLPGSTMAGDSCTVTVTFTPRFVGNRGGLMPTGTYLARPDPPSPVSDGPPAEMRGFGVIPGSAAAALAPTAVLPVGQTTSAKKKCKKKKGKAKKRCKRKLRKKKCKKKKGKAKKRCKRKLRKK